MSGIARTAGTTPSTISGSGRYPARGAHADALGTSAAASPKRSLAQACKKYLGFAMEHSHAYEVLFDGFAEPPSLHEPWPTFNLMRERVAQRLGGSPTGIPA